MAHLVIALYRPLPGKDAGLREELRTHHAILQRLKLATERPSLILRAKDGTYLEIFEWVSKEAVESAHSNPTVLQMWDRFGKVCEYVKLNDLEEAGDLFPNFELVEL